MFLIPLLLPRLRRKMRMKVTSTFQAVSDVQELKER